MGILEINNRLSYLANEVQSELQNVTSTTDRLRSIAGDLSTFNDASQVNLALNKVYQDIDEAVNELTQCQRESEILISRHNL